MDVFLFRILLVTLFFLSGCAGMKNSFMSQKSTGKDELIEAVGDEVTPIASKTVRVKLSRARLQKTLELGGDRNKARLVEVYRRNQPAGEPSEYRILDVRSNSVYSLMGIKSRDVLVAANNYRVPSQSGFWHFINQMPRLKEATLYIRREGVPILVEYQFSS